MINLLPDMTCCFELLGFDVMLDAHLKPWLIEVNSGPAMSMDCPTDYQVKPRLIKEMIGLLDFEPFEDFQERTKKPVKKSGAGGYNAHFFNKRQTTQPLPEVNKSG